MITHNIIIKKMLNLLSLAIYLCFTMEEIVKLYKKIIMKQINFFSPTIRFLYNPATICFCYNYCLNILQLIQVSKFKLKQKA